MACLLGSILVAWDGPGPHFGGLGDILGMACGPDWPGDPEWAGLHSGPGGSTVLLGSRDPGDGQS